MFGEHPETMAEKLRNEFTPKVFSTSANMNQHHDKTRLGGATSSHNSLKKLNEYRAIVCRLGNRTPTGWDMKTGTGIRAFGFEPAYGSHCCRGVSDHCALVL